MHLLIISDLDGFIYVSNSCSFPLKCLLKHNCSYALDDENCCMQVLSWLHESAYKKDQPNMTAAAFVNIDLLPNCHLLPRLFNNLMDI